MSVTNLAGEEIKMPQNAVAFRHQLETKWAGKNPHRWRQLAILSLIGDGWSPPNIAVALGLNRRHVYRVVRESRARIIAFATNSEPEQEAAA